MLALSLILVKGAKALALLRLTDERILQQYASFSYTLTKRLSKITHNDSRLLVDLLEYLTVR